MTRNWFREDVGSMLAERTALLGAIASTGRTFSRGLMPRTTAGQAVATGLTGSINYGLLATTQSALWAGASLVAARFMPDDLPDGADPVASYRWRVRAIAYGTYGACAVAAHPLRLAFAQQPGESVGRGVVRAYLHRLEQVSLIGAATTVLVDATFTVSGLAPGRNRRAVGTSLVVATGVGLAIAQVQLQRRRRARFTGERPPALDASAVAAGISTAVGLTVLGKAESLAAGGVAGLLEPALPHPVARSVGHGVCLTALGLAVWQAVEFLYRSIERSGSALEPMHQDRPTSAHVSGGPASQVQWSALSREGRRFAGMALSPEEIGEVMGDCRAEPVRVFVPLHDAQDAHERAALAISEMDALGAFERSVVAVCSPTGTGYINYVMAETVEYLTRGNSAIVAVQYSLRPSFLSLDRVNVGRANATALLAAVQARIAEMPEDRRPRLVLFGESLGAHTAQDVALHRGVAGFDQFGIDSGLFIGTPEESKWAKQWRADPAGTDPSGVVVEVDSFEEFRTLSEAQQRRARFVLITHVEDPITKFGPELAIREPAWLDRDRTRRPAGIPAEIDWRPLTTFFVTVADVLNSMTVIPGQFGAEGHDYRHDLARFVSAAFRLPCSPEEMERIEAALRRRELEIAQARLMAEHISTVRQGVAAKLAGWGVPDESVDDLLASEAARARRRAVRQYEADHAAPEADPTGSLAPRLG